MGPMVSEPNHLFQDSTTMSLINKMRLEGFDFLWSYPECKYEIEWFLVHQRRWQRLIFENFSLKAVSALN